jgi:hypothetical protein
VFFTVFTLSGVKIVLSGVKFFCALAASPFFSLKRGKKGEKHVKKRVLTRFSE